MPILPILIFATLMLAVAIYRLGSRARPGRRWILRVIEAVCIVLASVPLSIVTTLFLLPLWRWLESRYGIESVGHSGPAEWCFAAMFLAWLAVLVSGFFAIRSRRN